ncbi:MAG: AraC family transcriptional regulator [Lachnospiraceae bacterium]
MELFLDTAFCNFYPENIPLTFESVRGYEFIYFLEGYGNIIVDDVIIPYQKDDIYFLKPGTKRIQHAFERTFYCCVRFESNECFDFLSEPIFHDTMQSIRDEFEKLVMDYEDKDFDYFKLCNYKVNEIIIRLARLIPSNTEEQSDIYHMIKDIDSTLLYTKTVQEMAESLNYSYDYFRHKFKSITGKSPINYIMDKRVSHARDLLRCGEYSCSEISDMCGFSSSTQFSIIFKREAGLTPLNYQKFLKQKLCASTVSKLHSLR